MIRLQVGSQLYYQVDGHPKMSRILVSHYILEDQLYFVTHLYNKLWLRCVGMPVTTKTPVSCLFDFQLQRSRKPPSWEGLRISPTLLLRFFGVFSQAVMLIAGTGLLTVATAFLTLCIWAGGLPPCRCFHRLHWSIPANAGATQPPLLPRAEWQASMRHVCHGNGKLRWSFCSRTFALMWHLGRELAFGGKPKTHPRGKTGGVGGHPKKKPSVVGPRWS